MQKLLLLILPFFFFQGIYNYSLPAADGGTINLSDYQGKKMLLVNTASNSTNAAQYAKLEELYQEHKDSLIIIAVPSNSFGNEQDEDSILYNHVIVDYGVTFPVAAKQEVTGDSTCDLYLWLSRQALNGVMDNRISKDFQKFLIDGSGNLIGVFSASVDPLSKEMEDAINGVDE